MTATKTELTKALVSKWLKSLKKYKNWILEIEIRLKKGFYINIEDRDEAEFTKDCLKEQLQLFHALSFSLSRNQLIAVHRSYNTQSFGPRAVKTYATDRKEAEVNIKSKLETMLEDQILKLKVDKNKGFYFFVMEKPYLE